eukprot:scaffold6982_cov86-Amphora_coffeaeformis.AAC.2
MTTLQGESLFTIKLLSLRMNRFSPKTHLSERQLCVVFLSRSTAQTMVFSHLRIIDKRWLKDNRQLDLLLALITKTASLKRISVVSREWHALCSYDAFEREAALCGFSIKKYRTDNGIFTSKDYRQALAEGQSATRSAVGAHHQNGVAEANIGRVQRMARAMLLHLRLHWPDEFSPDLWPFALDYAVYIYNHVPRKGKAGAPSPIEFFCGAKVGCRPLRRLRVFGCPPYVLDPRLQDGKKIPKWEPRSRQGQFLGFSKEHATTIGLIRNTRTGYISPQFHVVYDEQFTTVTSDSSIDLQEHWIDLFSTLVNHTSTFTMNPLTVQFPNSTWNINLQIHENIRIRANHKNMLVTTSGS